MSGNSLRQTDLADCQEPGSALGPYAWQSSMRYLYRFTSRERGSWSRDGSDTWKQMSRERTKQHSNPVLYNALRVGEPPTTAAAITETLQQRGMLEHADNDGHGQHDGRLMNMVLQEHQQPVKADHSLHVLTEPAHTSPPATCSGPPTRPASKVGYMFCWRSIF